MRRAVVLPTLVSFALKNFRPIFKVDAQLKLLPGANLIIGGNGLGKTTLMQAIVYGMAGGTEDVEDDKAKRWDHRYFQERLARGEDESPIIEVAFSFGNTRITVRRAFTSSRVIGFRLGNAGWIEGDDDDVNPELAYREALDLYGGYRSPRDFAFLVHKLLYLPETRNLIAWDTDAQIRILMLLNQDIAPEEDFDDRRAMLVRLDSARRHKHVDLNKVLRRLEELKPAVKRKSSEKRTKGKEDDSAVRLQEITSELNRVGKDRLVAERDGTKAQSHLSGISEQVEALREQVDAAEAALVWESVSKQEKESTLPIQKLVEIGICPVCGSHNHELQMAAIRHHREHSCTLCGSNIVQESDVALATLRSKLSEKLRAKTALEDELRIAQARLAELRRVEGDLQRQINEIRFSLPTPLSDVQIQGGESRAQLSRRSKTLMAEESTLAAQIRELTESLEHDYERFRNAILQRAKKLRDAYERYATEFLGMRCELQETTDEDRLLSLMRFVPQFDGVSRPTPYSCSEAQRFFLDIAFRMALVDLASTLSNNPASFLCETPENALDFTYVDNVVRMFQEFAKKRHSFLLTVNLQSEGIAELLLASIAKGEKRARVINLLEIGRLSSVQNQQKSKIDGVIRRILK